MTAHVEVRPGEGGDDAALFAKELIEAITWWLEAEGHDVTVSGETSLTVEVTGRSLERL